MKELEDKIESLINQNVYSDEHIHRTQEASEKIAKEIKDIAIEFAKITNTKVGKALRTTNTYEELFLLFIKDKYRS